MLVLAALEKAYERCIRGVGAPSPPLEGLLFDQYVCWRQAIPPTREWRGRGGQNPRLLEAFQRLAAVEARCMGEE